MRRCPHLLACGLLLIALAASAAPAERRPLGPDGEVRVSVGHGDVAILGWDRPVCEVQSDGRVPLRVTGDHHRLEVVPADARDVRAKLEVHVPHGCSVSVVTVAADIWIEGLTGDVTIETVSGEVEVRGRLRRLNASRVTGDLHLDATVESAIATTVNGDIVISQVTRELVCNTLDGDVDVFAAPGLDRLEVTSLNGDATVVGPIGPRARWQLNLQNGDAILTVTRPVDATFRLQALLGDIACGFPRATPREDTAATRRGEVYRVGNGRAAVAVEVLRGDITIDDRAP
ncbi:MAG: DUF4097 family beta strand repeat-containing protein [Candidatus Krumholzibacteriia bacterium]